MQFSKLITRSSRFIQRLRAFPIRRQRSNRPACRDSLPTKFERGVQPDTQAIIFFGECAVSLNRPRAAAERDHARGIVFESSLQRPRFERAECRLAVLFDNL